ncbi:hypothetical protein BGW42_007142 [Actinomortierella wolfii]|nr:hypothetical protein BGW42_007142 [Actinomortierella wolfii]
MNESAFKSNFEYDLSPKSDSTFVLYYFKLHGSAAAIRAMLCHANVVWKDKFTSFGAEWEAEKPKTPFGALPILYETRPDGEERMLPETSAIERYLARKFGFMGSDDWEEAQINVFVSLIEEAAKTWFFRIFEAEGDEARAKKTQEWIDKDFAKLIAHVEAQLDKNDLCGHIIGRKTTYADLLLDGWLDVWMAMDTGKIVNQTLTPGIWKLRQKMVNHPGYATYRKSEVFQAFDKDAQAFFGSQMDYDVKRSQV